jgi:hypothetical protein
MTISQKIKFPIQNKDTRWDTQILCWRDSLFVGALISLCCSSREGGKNGIALVGAMDMSAIIALRGVRVSTLGECAQLAIIMRHMMVVVAPAAQVRVRMGTEHEGNLEQE